MSLGMKNKVDAFAMWRRRNEVELYVRRAIEGQPGLRIFGIGLDRKAGADGEFFVTLTATSSARKQASRLLRNCSGLSEQDWMVGWRQLDLGDWMIRIYPERHS
jgi:hypothetical protein